LLERFQTASISQKVEILKQSQEEVLNAKILRGDRVNEFIMLATEFKKVLEQEHVDFVYDRPTGIAVTITANGVNIGKCLSIDEIVSEKAI